MPIVNIDVPEGSRITVRNGPGFWRSVGLALGEASEDARHDREARQAKRYRNKFQVGELVMSAKRNGSPVHAVVRVIGKPGPNENISVHFAGHSHGSGNSPWELACRWNHATLSSRISCELRCCRAWKALGPWQRWKRRHELVEG